MKKHGILNSQISRVLSSMGHTDTICIADCGLPIPPGVERIDVSISKGIPSFLQVVSAVAEDMVVERVTLAAEVKDKNQQIDQEINKIFPDAAVEYILHNQFKALSAQCKAVIRTGEATPYANVILHSGVNF